MGVAYALAGIINRELRALVAAGADSIQLDEPSYAVHPDAPGDFVALFNDTVAGVAAKIGLHLCFGNYVGRPVAKRTYRPLFPHILDVHASQLALEFASREMAEIELAREIRPPMGLAVGLVDVKNTWVEPAELVADRLRLVLKHIEPERVHVTPDCGFSQTARFIATAKLAAMVEGVRLVRHELTPS